MIHLQKQSIIIALLAAVAATTTTTVQAEPDVSICNELKTEAEGLFKGNTDASCECTQDVDTAIEYTCLLDPICLQSPVGDGEALDPYAGIMETKVVKDNLDQPSYSQRLVRSVCFTYNNDLYDGAKVCHENVPENLGGLGTCEIQVDGEACELCEYCPGRDDNFDLRSVFDCNNVGAEEGRVCTADYSNTTETLLRFLSQPEISTSCPGFDTDNGGGDDGSSPAASNFIGLAGVVVASNFVFSLFL